MKWLLGIALTLQLAQSDGLTPAVTLTQEAWERADDGTLPDLPERTTVN